jgi:hypothetical protein
MTEQAFALFHVNSGDAGPLTRTHWAGVHLQTHKSAGAARWWPTKSTEDGLWWIHHRR